jgi:small subunit ribosomal protein S6
LKKPYETTFIVDAHLSNEQIESTINKYSKFIADNGGSIKLTDRWGKRRLAYEISKKQYGYYVYIRFDADGDLIQTLEREYKLDDTIIRYLTLRVPKVLTSKEGEQKEKSVVDESESENSENDMIEKTDDKTEAVETESSRENTTEEEDLEKTVSEEKKSENEE